jgi:hypothetical protein
VIGRIGSLAAATLVLSAASVSAGEAPAVPPFIQNQLAKRAGATAFVPTRLPFHYRYRSFSVAPGTAKVTLRFADNRFAPSPTRTVTFTASRFTGARCAAGKRKTLQLAGNKVYWDGTRAWRCQGGVILAAVGANLPDSALGRVVASALRARR